MAAKKKASKKSARKKASRRAASAKSGAPAESPAVAVPVRAEVRPVDDDEDLSPGTETAETVAEAPARERKPIPKMPARRRGVITLAVGVEADAAFMLYALEHAKVDLGDRTYQIVRQDQPELDEQAPDARFDLTMLSLGAYPRVDDRYMLLPCGGSFGDQRGPLLVARTPIRASEVEGLSVAAPGRYSAAAMALRLWLPKGRFEMRPMSARAVSLVVRANKARSGLLVTEDQLSYKVHHLIPIVDLGQWWGEETEGLPLPLSMCGIRRDIDEAQRALIALDLKRSIAYGLGHREEALEYAASFARKASPEHVDRFVDRYVNDLSLDCGERGRQAIQLLYDRAVRHGVLDETVWPEFHGVEG